MQLKPGVKAAGIQPEILLALMVAQEVYREMGRACVVTSLLDGKHSDRSLHYEGLAMDLRTRHLTPQEAGTVVALLKERLGAEYDVVLEKDHIHVEFDPTA